MQSEEVEMKKLAVLSDIHGNLEALQCVKEDMEQFQIDAVILLGDLIDYGMQSNEVITFLKKKFSYPILCNLWGNHEHAILFENYTEFSSARGRESAMYTRKILTESSKLYLENNCQREGLLEFEYAGKSCLAVHGSLEDVFWKGIVSDSLSLDYKKYDIVFSGHTHCAHYFQRFYECERKELRNRKSVFFLNPGSVGQPRNQNPCAQYLIIDMETLELWFRAVPYPIERVEDLYRGQIDLFYRDRLKWGV